MNKEIKEILDRLKDDSKALENSYYRLFKEDRDKLLDYITNLQEEVNKLTAESTEWESKCYDLQENKKLKENKLAPDELVNLLNQELIKQRDDYKSRIDKAIPMLKELNIKIKEILKINIDIKEISDIENIFRGVDEK